MTVEFCYDKENNFTKNERRANKSLKCKTLLGKISFQTNQLKSAHRKVYYYD